MKLKKKLMIIVMVNTLLLQLTAETFDTRFALTNLVTKTDFDNKLINLIKKINSNKTKYLIVKNEFKKLDTFDSIYFSSKSHFKDDGTQNYLIFQPAYRYFNDIDILSWKSKVLSDEIIKPPSTSSKILNP